MVSNPTPSELPLEDWLKQEFRNNDAPITQQPAHDQAANEWTEIRLFLSSTFIDTHAERDVIIKRVIPSINRRLSPRFIRVTPVDLRWGVLAEESKDCAAIQKTCLNQLDKCRWEEGKTPWFLGLRTARYGWVQDRIMNSEGFEHPLHCRWLDNFIQSEKNVSITSLECIHATATPKETCAGPTVFFYERDIENAEEVESELRWVFDFEHVSTDAELDEAVKYQYARTEFADVYKNDKNDLDKYLNSLDYVKYARYPCKYEKGGARFTCRNENRKSFGIGYVSHLDEFERMVETDLLNSIESNFTETDISGIPDYILKNIQHENAVRQRAASFVGRNELFNECLKQSSGDYPKSSVLVIHGDPGCGKSALLAAVTTRCMDALRAEGHFVFVHAVDSCPGSNNLEGMLRRLQTNLRRYRINVCGDAIQTSDNTDGLSEDPPQNVVDLKREHVKFLEESAKTHSNKKFVIFIDAVNQFHDTLQAWRMWWLPTTTTEFKNLRVVISTLNSENGTFQNACEIAPSSTKILVDKMLYKDRQEMVSEILKRYNKKLTTYDDSFLGNQMDILLRKSDSPLYLIAATEALRKFGIFEKVTEYIGTIPDTIRTLFGFLLEEWVGEYGSRFTRDVMGLLWVSRDGLLENEINDVLAFRESESGEMYDCSFSRLYDALSSFLAAGGGGFLRFFHDQLKYEVEAKLLTNEIKVNLHQWLIDFYLSCIRPQLVENPPADLKPAYYDHCLEQIVYHQLEMSRASGMTSDFSFTLRNIYFIRERITHKQEELLSQEYISVERACVDSTQLKALKQWSKFAKLYSPYIKRFPHLAHNMAVNQIPSSAVRQDTDMQTEDIDIVVEIGETYPMYWTNILANEDSMIVKYTMDQCMCCAASERAKNLCCVGSGNIATLFEMDSGVVVHQVQTQGQCSTIYISKHFNSFWTGDANGDVTIWNCETGTEETKHQLNGSDVIWIQPIDKENVACGTGRKYGELTGEISIFNSTGIEIIRSWPTDENTHSYCYHAQQEVILSTHYAMIKCWNKFGQLLKTIKFGQDYIVSITASAVQDKMAFVTMNTVDYNVVNYTCDIHQMTYANEKYINMIDTKKTDFVLYDNKGERIFCTGEQCKTVMVYNANEGSLENKLKAHSYYINSMCLVPGSNELLTAAYDGSVRFDIPSLPDQNVGEESEEAGLIGWCDFLPGGDEFATLDEHGNFEIWNAETQAPVRRTHIEGARWAALQPRANHFAVYTYNSIHWLNTDTMKIVKDLVLDEDSNLWIWDIQFPNDGNTCLVLTYQNGAIVFDCADLDNIERRVTYTMDGYMQTAHIHEDGIQAVTGGTAGVDIWLMTTGQTIRKVNNSQSNFVRFLHNPDRIMYANYWGQLAIMNMDNDDDEESIIYLQGYVSNPPAIALLNNGRELITGDVGDKTLTVHNIETGEIVYAFVEHRSTLFNCLAVHPDNHTVLAYNQNGIFYILKNKR